MESNSSLMCSGFRMSSSLDERGWEEAKASTPITPTISFRTIKSFWKMRDICILAKWRDQTHYPYPHWSNLKRYPFSILSRQLLSLDVFLQELSTGGENSPCSTLVQHSWLRDKRHRWQTPRWATGHSTTSWSPSSQTTVMTELHFYWQVFKHISKLNTYTIKDVIWSFWRALHHWMCFSVIPYERARARWLLPPTPYLHWMTPQDYIRGRFLCRWSGPSSPWLRHWSREEQSGLKTVKDAEV